MKVSPPDRYGITALQRGLQLLNVVGSSAHAVTASEICSLSGLHSSTVHRFLVNLEAAGFLIKDGTAGGYLLGPACVALSRAALDRLDVRRISLPYLQELNRTTRETVHLTVRHKLSAVYIEKIDSPEPLRIFSQIGAAVPLHCSAVGKCLLAYASQSEQEQLLPKVELVRLTANTITSPQKLQAELIRVRRQGYAIDSEENELNIRCISGPIWDHNGNVHAAFSVTGPAARMNKARLRQLAPIIRTYSRKISASMGYRLPSGSKSQNVSVLRAIVRVNSGDGRHRAG